MRGGCEGKLGTKKFMMKLQFLFGQGGECGDATLEN